MGIFGFFKPDNSAERSAEASKDRVDKKRRERIEAQDEVPDRDYETFDLSEQEWMERGDDEARNTLLDSWQETGSLDVEGVEDVEKLQFIKETLAMMKAGSGTSNDKDLVQKMHQLETIYDGLYNAEMLQTDLEVIQLGQREEKETSADDIEDVSDEAEDDKEVKETKSLSDKIREYLELDIEVNAAFDRAQAKGEMKDPNSEGRQVWKELYDKSAQMNEDYFDDEIRAALLRLNTGRKKGRDALLAKLDEMVAEEILGNIKDKKEVA
jgi:hypothetical protein